MPGRRSEPEVRSPALAITPTSPLRRTRMSEPVAEPGPDEGTQPAEPTQATDDEAAE